VILPVGAIEQHGPHLPVGTDSLITGAVVDADVDRAAGAAPCDLVLAPGLSMGASDHHLAFGGTLSLTVEVMTAALIDLARSVAQSGGRRLLFVNGHGGNRGPCDTAALAASTRHGIAVGYLDYWSLLDADEPGANIPGHAGAFETSLVSHLRPDLVSRYERPGVPTTPAVPGITLHRQASWTELDGHSDDPAGASAAAGRSWFEQCVSGLADRIIALAQQL
jgi:creatinine amidohydrolase